MRIYIAGKITGLDNYRELFNSTEEKLTKQGHIVINPSMLPEGLGEHNIYMKICFAMIDAVDIIYMLPNYKDSKGAIMELEYAKKKGVVICYGK